MATSIPIVRTRKEFWELMERHVSKTYYHLAEETKLPYEHNYLKSYLIEVNSLDPRAIPMYIRQIKLRQTELSAEVIPTDDPRLYNVILIAKTRRRDKTSIKRAVFYLEISPQSPRFWVFHTIEKSQTTDYLLKHLILKPGSKLDSPWFSTALLLDFSEKLGELRGLGIQYKYSEVFENWFEEEANKDKDGGFEELPEGSISPEDIPFTEGIFATEFTMRIWGEVSWRILRKFIEDEDLQKLSAISSIGIKREEDHEKFIIEDITFWGKFLSRGTSFLEHIKTIHEIESRYFRVLSEKIETELLSAEKSNFGYRPKGSPFIITLKNTELTDNPKFFDSFVNKIFSGKPPFRIFGIKSKVAKDEYVIYGTDLHNGDPIELEVTPEWITIHLRSIPNKNVCGNTILRFLTNIQRYYDPQAELESEENGPIF